MNATFCAPAALPARLALVAQSGAVSAAMLDFAAPLRIGFSTVISLGGGIDVGFGELLDALVIDPATDGILLYVENLGDARAFISALRAAARTKPVVVLKAGRSLEMRGRDADARDAVFDAALTRSRHGARANLCAALRRRAHSGDGHAFRAAIGSRSFPTAADRRRSPPMQRAERGVTLAKLAPATVAALDAILPRGAARAPIRSTCAAAHRRRGSPARSRATLAGSAASTR